MKEKHIPDKHGDKIFEDLFRSLPKYHCPEYVTDAIAKVTCKKQCRNIYEWFFWKVQPVFKWAAPAIAAALLVLFFYRINAPEPATMKSLDGYSEADLKKIQAQTRYSLAYVGQVMNKSKNETIQDVVLKRLPDTIRKSLNAALPILKGGSQ